MEEVESKMIFLYNYFIYAIIILHFIMQEITACFYDGKFSVKEKICLCKILKHDMEM